MRRSISAISRGVACVLGASFAVACGGPPLGELAAEEVTLTVRGVASDPGVAALGEPAGGLGVSRAIVSASAVSLEPCAEDAADIALLPRSYELLQDPPPSERVTTAVYELCRLRVDVEAPATAVEGVPEGTALYVEASDAEGNTFTWSSPRSTSLRFAADAASSFGEQPLLLGFDLSTWLAGFPLEAGSADDTASGSAALLDDQLHAAAALFVDANGNGELDDDESTPVALGTP